MVAITEQYPGLEVDYAHICSVSDVRAGNVRQATALADAIAALGPLGNANAAPAATLQLVPRAPWRWAAPRRLPLAGLAFGEAFAQRLARPPLLAVGCGRQAALATRLLGSRGARTVQVLDPRLDPRHWDLVVAPAHDRLAGDNVITTLGSLHPVDDAWLAAARTRFPELGALPGPRTAVLLGGPSTHAAFGTTEQAALWATLDAAVARNGGSLLVTASRRTPAAVRAALRADRARWPGVTWVDDADGDNPYPGLLAWADRIVCSADSVNMLSEACATRVPVFVVGVERVRGRPARFLEALLASGRARALDDAMQPFDSVPLRETARVAAAVRDRLFP